MTTLGDGMVDAQAYPERYVQFGISEQDSEHIRMDVAYTRLPVRHL